MKATAQAHPNIALAKYWGKAPGPANAPAVPSLSVTLAGLTTVTSVELDRSLPADRLTINGRDEDATRVTSLLDRVRREAGETTRARIVTTNDFPTSAGLASSASGFAALAVAARAALGLPFDPTRASDLARRTSASSARSLFGGFVELDAGDGTDRDLPAREVAPAEHLDLRVVVAVTTEAPKDESSTSGMNTTSAHSPYYAAWLEHAPRLYEEVRRALLARDLDALGAAAEASALAMHASAIAAGVVYFRGATVDALAEVRRIRASGTSAYATIDAGPHVKTLVRAADAQAVAARLAAVPGVLRVLVAAPGPGASLVADR
ncbi:MAG: diphosphomevalonate decarboxylase [Polyangiaceae bacterium]|nr:diphosphomevalonate decarboxylase [Polyangiaceae bacterium]